LYIVLIASSNNRQAGGASPGRDPAGVAGLTRLAAVNRGFSMAEGDDRKQLTLRIPQDVHKKVRILAALHEMTMTEYFISLVEDDYRQHAKETGPVQLKLPT